MRPYPVRKPTPIDYNNPFTKNLLGNLVGAARAQPNETEAEYNARYIAVVTAWAAFGPRDPLEQMLAAQIVGAHYAALDCLTLAMQAEDLVQHGRLQRNYATLNHVMRDSMRALTKLQERPAEALAPEQNIQPVAPPRRPVIPAKQANHPIQREVHRSPTGRVYDFTHDPAKMDDEELAAAIAHFKGRIAAEQANGAESPHAP